MNMARMISAGGITLALMLTTLQAQDARKPALPAGHPTVPGDEPALPSGHPAIPSGHPPLPAGHPAVNPQNGATTEPVTPSIDIRVIQGTPGGPRIAAGTPVLELYDGPKMVAAMPTPLEPDGHVHVYDVPMERPFVPLVKMIYNGIEYQAAGQPITRSKMEQDITCVVFETTDQPVAWTVDMRHVMLERTDKGVEVNEVFVLNNPTDRVLTGAKDSEGKRSPIFAWPVPVGVGDVTVHGGFQAAALKLQSFKIINPVGILPGQSEYHISYTLPYQDGRAELALATPVQTKAVTVVVPPDEGMATATGLNDNGITDMGGMKVHLFKATDVPPEKILRVALKQIGAATQPAAMVETSTGITNAPSPGMIESHTTSGHGFSPQMLAIIGVVAVAVIGLIVILMRRSSQATKLE